MTALRSHKRLRNTASIYKLERTSNLLQLFYDIAAAITSSQRQQQVTKDKVI